MGGMTIADLRFSAGQKLPSHAHELATITVTMDGNFETLIEGRAYQNPLHAVLCKPQGSMHGNAFGRTAVRVVMLAAPTVTVVPYPNGRYELRGDGMTVPYYWAWVPAQLYIAPPPPPAG